MSTENKTVNQNQLYRSKFTATSRDFPAIARLSCFHRRTEQYMCNTVIIKNTYTKPQTRRYSRYAIPCQHSVPC